MKIKYVEIENILSIEKIRVDFEDSGLVLVDGWNHDDDTANGSGKTAILNCIAFGLYGKFPRNITVSDLLRHGTKMGYVKVGVEANSHLYEVARARPNNLRFFIDGVEKVDYTQEQFEIAIKIDYALYLLIMYSSQFEYRNIIQANDTDKKNFFLQLLNLSKFTEHKKNLDSKIKQAKDKIIKLQREESSVSSKILTLKSFSIDEASLYDKIEAEDISNKIQEYKDIKASLVKPDVSKIEDLENALQEKYYDLASQAQSIKQDRQSVAEWSELIQDIPTSTHVDCPECGHSFPLDPDMEKRHDIHIASLQKKIDEANNRIVSAKDTLEERKKIKEKLLKCKEKKQSQTLVYEKAIEDLSEMKADIVAAKQRISNYTSQIEKNKTIGVEISDCEKQLSFILVDQEKLQQKITIWETISHMLSPTGAPAYLLDSLIEIFNTKMSTYVDMLWPSATYLLKTYKENKGGDIKAKFSEHLSIHGRDRSIGSLSGGELRCLSICADIAALETLETILGVELNPLMWDEPFNDLDASNRERVMDMLSMVSRNRQMVIVDHSSEVKSMFSKVIQVEKRGSVSRLV